MGKGKASKAKERKRKARREKLQRERHERRFGSSSKSTPLMPRTLPTAVAAERILRLLEALAGEGPFRSEKEAAEHFDRLAGRPLEELRSKLTDPAELAQQLAYDAMEARDPARQEEAVRAALALDPTNLDARRLEIGRIKGDLDAEEVWRRMRELGGDATRALTESKILESSPGGAWDHVRARPWLRAMRAAALTATAADRHHDALEGYRTILAADDHDVLQVAGLAAGVALRTGLLEDARAFVALAGDAPLGRWMHAIERFASGDQRGAATLLDVAVDEDEELVDTLLRLFGAAEGAAPGPEIPSYLREDVGAVMTAAAGKHGTISFVLDAIALALSEQRELAR